MWGICSIMIPSGCCNSAADCLYFPRTPWVMSTVHPCQKRSMKKMNCWTYSINKKIWSYGEMPFDKPRKGRWGWCSVCLDVALFRQAGKWLTCLLMLLAAVFAEVCLCLFACVQFSSWVFISCRLWPQHQRWPPTPGICCLRGWDQSLNITVSHVEFSSWDSRREFGVMNNRYNSSSF